MENKEETLKFPTGGRLGVRMVNNGFTVRIQSGMIDDTIHVFDSFEKTVAFISSLTPGEFPKVKNTLAAAYVSDNLDLDNDFAIRC